MEKKIALFIGRIKERDVRPDDFHDEFQAFTYTDVKADDDDYFTWILEDLYKVGDQVRITIEKMEEQHNG